MADSMGEGDRRDGGEQCTESSSSECGSTVSASTSSYVKASGLVAASLGVCLYTYQSFGHQLLRTDIECSCGLNENQEHVAVERPLDIASRITGNTTNVSILLLSFLVALLTIWSRETSAKQKKEDAQVVTPAPEVEEESDDAGDETLNPRDEGIKIVNKLKRRLAGDSYAVRQLNHLSQLLSGSELMFNQSSKQSLEKNLSRRLSSMLNTDQQLSEVAKWLAATYTGEPNDVINRNRPKKTFKAAVSMVILANRMRKLRANKSRDGLEANIPQLPIIVNQRISSSMSTLYNWSFDVFKVNELSEGRSLLCVAYTLFQHHQLFLKFPKLNQDKFVSLISRIETLYRNSNAYHNRIHAADVTQCLNFIITSPGVMECLTDIDVLSAILAAVFHDVDHPGFTNLFNVNVGSQLAYLYNDRCVLENHHASVALCAMAEPELNFIENLPTGQKKEIREGIIDMVLATDMASHFQHLAEFQSAVESGKKFDINSKEDRQMLLRFALHSADLSNPARPLQLCLQWTNRVMSEFFVQGDKERELGMEISPMMDRTKVSIPKSQVGFIKVIVNPMFEAWSKFHTDMEVCRDHLKVNQRYWEEKAESEEAGEN